MSSPRLSDELDDEEFMRQLTWCEEDRHLHTTAPWSGGYRWFRSTNIIPLERHRPPCIKKET